MSDYQTIARPYAKAAFALANEAKQLNQWSEFLAFSALVIEDAVTGSYLTNPRELSTTKARFIIEVLEAGMKATKMTDEQRHFIQLLAENLRLNAMGDILIQYEALKREVDGVVDVKVISARKLTSAQTKSIVTKLKARLGKEVTINAEIDKSLIAGAIIYADDVVIDGSARGKLNKLATSLSK